MNPPKDPKKELTDDWFDPKEATAKRKELAELLLDLQQSQPLRQPQPVMEDLTQEPQASQEPNFESPSQQPMREQSMSQLPTQPASQLSQTLQSLASSLPAKAPGPTKAPTSRVVLVAPLPSFLLNFKRKVAEDEDSDLEWDESDNKMETQLLGEKLLQVLAVTKVI